MDTLKLWGEIYARALKSVEPAEACRRASAATAEAMRCGAAGRARVVQQRFADDLEKHRVALSGVADVAQRHGWDSKTPLAQWVGDQADRVKWLEGELDRSRRHLKEASDLLDEAQAELAARDKDSGKGQGAVEETTGPGVPVEEDDELPSDGGVL